MHAYIDTYIPVHGHEGKLEGIYKYIHGHRQ